MSLPVSYLGAVTLRAKWSENQHHSHEHRQEHAHKYKQVLGHILYIKSVIKQRNQSYVIYMK